MTEPTRHSSKYEIRTGTAVVQADADHVTIDADAGVLLLTEADGLVACVPLQQLVYCIRTSD
jgi:hypothetical protein